MKKFLVLLCLVAASAQAEVVVEKTPVYDIPKCLEQASVGTRDIVYSVVKEEIKDNKREITFKADLYTCMEVPGGYGFRASDSKDAQMFLFVDGKVVVANRSITAIKVFRITEHNEVEVYDLKKSDDDYKVTVVLNKDETNATFGTTVITDVLYAGDVLYSGATENTRPTYISIK